MLSVVAVHQCFRFVRNENAMWEELIIILRWCSVIEPDDDWYFEWVGGSKVDQNSTFRAALRKNCKEKFFRAFLSEILTFCKKSDAGFLLSYLYCLSLTRS